jgi:hypothetical protein
VLLFEKPSLRTRVSFEIGFARFGGTAVYLDHQNNPIGVRETVADYGHNLERWCDCIVARVMKQSTIEVLASTAEIPVINALSDLHHPCQALADFMTLVEHGFDFHHDRLAWVGDGNNVCHSLIEMAATVGCGMTVVTPPGAEPEEEVKVPLVPFPVALPADPELLWVLARREDLAPEEASRALLKIEEDFWETKVGLKLLRDRVEKTFAEFIARVPAGALAEHGLKRHYKTPETRQVLSNRTPEQV